MIEAVIFDMDGVLIDSEKLKAEAWKETLQRHGVLNGDLWYNRNIGQSRKILCQKAKEEFSLSINIEELSNERGRIYYNMLNKTEPILPAIEFLRTIKQKCAVASSTAKEIMEQQLRQIGVYDLFEVIVSGEDDLEKNKPSPDVYLLCAKRLGVSPEKCLVIEDSMTGIQAAKAAGMQCAAYNVPINQDSSEADFVAEDFKELQKLLSG